jgi:hypothetical protein
MASNCCNSFGGRVYFEVDGVRLSPTDADVILDVTDREVEAQANQDGSAAFIVRPRLPGAEVTFRNNCDVDWAALTKKCKINVSIEEEDNDRTHLFTACRLVGRPRQNLTTGEVTGVSFAGQAYQRI